MNGELERHVAVVAVSQASRLCRAVRAELATVEAVAKGDRSPVTIADFGSQALVCRQLVAAFPQDPIVAEEDARWLRQPENAPQLEQVMEYVGRWVAGVTPQEVCRWVDAGTGEVAERFWTLDPVDGTKGFLRRDQYAIALALIEGGEVRLAVLACPALPVVMEDPDSDLGTLFVAVRGEGASMVCLGGTDYRRMAVASAEEGTHLRLVESVEAGHGDWRLQEQVARAVGITRPPLKLDSQVKYGAVARGDAVLYLRFPSPDQPEYREKIWDHAAGSLIVEEAGGRVTDMYGRRLEFAAGRAMERNRGIVAGNPELHRAALEALRATLDWH